MSMSLRVGAGIMSGRMILQSSVSKIKPEIASVMQPYSTTSKSIHLQGEQLISINCRCVLILP